MDNRLHEINKLLREYSKGNFEKRLNVSDQLDEIDACITSINMLGEELRDATISRNYFNNIFNSVSDMVFVLNKKGNIEDINQSVSTQLKYERQQLTGKLIDELCVVEKSLFKNTVKQLNSNSGVVTKTTYFQTSDQVRIPVELTATWLINERNQRNGILLTAKDITIKQQTENLVLRAIIDTAERERQRLARDLHDSLGQKISAIKFYIAASAATVQNRKQQLILKKSNRELNKIHGAMREICFNLIPNTLAEFGLLTALKELCNQVTKNNKISFDITPHKTLPALPLDMATDIFRIIQEFINNGMRHGNATKIKIAFLSNESYFIVNLKDNGTGFDLNKTKTNGMGLQNVKSRVKSHNGEIKIKSAVGKGTEYFISFPLNEQL